MEGRLVKPRGICATCSMSAFPHSDQVADMPDRSELGHKATYAVQQNGAFLITSSARVRSDCGTESPSAFAVPRLVASSYLVGASIGRSSGGWAHVRRCVAFQTTSKPSAIARL